MSSSHLIPAVSLISNHPEHQCVHIFCVCVFVCVRERETDRQRGIMIFCGFLFFVSESLNFPRCNQNSILELIVSVCRDCVISTDVR